MGYLQTTLCITMFLLCTSFSNLSILTKRNFGWMDVTHCVARTWITNSATIIQRKSHRGCTAGQNWSLTRGANYACTNSHRSWEIQCSQQQHYASSLVPAQHHHRWVVCALQVCFFHPCSPQLSTRLINLVWGLNIKFWLSMGAQFWSFQPTACEVVVQTCPKTIHLIASECLRGRQCLLIPHSKPHLSDLVTMMGAL